ncbi:MAG: hypothetical protein ABIH38_01400 [Patescibacteria group bacterium]
MNVKEVLLIVLASLGLLSGLVTVILLEMTSRKIKREIDFNWINPDAIKKINWTRTLTCITITLLGFILFFLLT